MKPKTLEEKYRLLEDKILQAEVDSSKKRIEPYNGCARILEQALFMIVQNALICDFDKLPKAYRRLKVGTRTVFAWPLWTYEPKIGDDVVGWSIYLTHTVKLVAVDKSGEVFEKPRISLIDSEKDMFLVETDFAKCDLKQLYDSVFEKADELGFTPEDDWPKTAEY